MASSQVLTFSSLLKITCPSYTYFSLGTADTHYSYLRKTLLGAKESVFGSVDSAGSIYNKWTIDFAPLAVLRVVALGLGCYALYEIWGIE